MMYSQKMTNTIAQPEDGREGGYNRKVGNTSQIPVYQDI